MGQRQVRALVRDPMPMTLGKKTPAQLSFALDHLINPRSCGHLGIVILHSTFDRAPFESLTRMLTQFYTRMAPHIDCATAEDDKHDPETWFLQFWMLKTACAYHDVHKSFHWAVF